MKVKSTFLDDFISLFYPELCPGCGKNLFKNENVICTDCIYHLPYTNFHEDPENRVAKQLWGRIPFQMAASYLYFRKGSRVQNMLHQFKYNNRPDIGLRLGEMYGLVLSKSGLFNAAHYIIPVPLHPAKLKKRGYNQSAYFAEGLSGSLNIPVLANGLKRLAATETQTKKSRFVRYENMKDVFDPAQKEQLQDKHILLVDDVITTGATIEACALELLKLNGTQVSIATIAFTD
ncbi:MAG: phosphoribosyltransferase [Sphingobacteriaceae bacterium]|nr:phosphoribosyltransferase [Sphingobacteriaceae bacterium]